MSESGSFILRPTLDTSGIASGIAEVQNLLVSSAETISAGLNKAFAQGLAPTKIGASLASSGPAGAAASAAVRGVVATGQAAGLSEAQIKEQIRQFLPSLGLQSAAGGEFNKGTTTQIINSLYANATKQLVVEQSITEEANARLAASRTTTEQQRQIAASAQLQTALYQEQLARGREINEALAYAKSETEARVAAISAGGKNEERITYETLMLAELTSKRTEAIQAQFAAGQVQRNVEEGARTRYAAALEQLATQVSEQLGAGVAPGSVGRRLTTIQEAFAAVLEEEHQAGRNGLIAQGELNAQLKEAAAATSLTAREQRLLASQVERHALALAPTFSDAVSAATRGYEKAQEEGAKAPLGIEERYVAAQEKRLREAEEAVQLEAEQNVVQAGINRYKEQLRVLTDRVVEVQGEVVTTAARDTELRRQLLTTLSSANATEEQKLAAANQSTEAAKAAAAASVRFLEEKERLDAFVLTGEVEYVAAIEKLVQDQLRVVAVAQNAYRAAGVPISRTQEAGGEATTAELQAREAARRSLATAQAELALREGELAIARASLEGIQAETQAQVDAQAGLTVATKNTLTAEERRAVIATEFNTALRVEYEKRLAALQAGGDILAGTGISGTQNLAQLRARVDPFFAQRAVSRADEGVAASQARLLELQRIQAEQQARGGLGVNEERVTNEQIAAAREEVTSAYARLSRALLQQAEVNERDTATLLRSPVTRIASLQQDVRATIELDLQKRQELLALQTANYDQLSAAQQEVVQNVRLSAAAAAKAAEQYNALFSEEAALPAVGRVLFPGKGEPVGGTDQRLVDIARRQAADELAGGDEAKRRQADTEFAKLREDRAAALERDLEALDEQAVADQQAAAKAREESELRDIGAGRRGRLIQGVADPNAGVVAQGEALAIAQQDALTTTKQAEAALQREVTALEEATGSSEQFDAQLKRVQTASARLEAAQAALTTAHAALEEQLAAERAARTTSPEADLNAALQANIAVTQELTSARTQALEALDVSNTSVIEQTAATTRVAAAANTFARRLEEASSRTAEDSLALGAANARNRQIARVGGLASQLGIEAPVFGAETATAEITATANQLAAQLRERALAENQAAAAARREAAASDEVAVAAGGGRGGGRGFIGGFKSRFGFSDSNPEGDVAGSFGSSLAQQARFFLPFTLAFGAYRQIKDAIKDAQELEKVLAITKLQFEDLGKGAQFEQFRNSIIDISKATGQSAAEVALVAQQLQAAFGGDTARALRETQAAMEAIRISGLSGQQVVNDFTAVIKSFGDASTSVSQLTDTAVGLQERFGVLVKDTIEFSGAIAPIAAETGFTAKQIEALGAAYQEFSGRAGSTGAENLGRVLSGIQDKAVQLVQFLNANAPNLAEPIAKALSSGNIEQVFETLLANYSQLTEAQQEQLLATLGGRRETAALSAIFKDHVNVLNELQGNTNDTGKAQQAFANTEKTLAQQVAELGSQFSALGIELYDSGIGDILKGIVHDVSALVDALSGLVSMFQSVNEASHGTLGLLVQIAAEAAILAKTLQLIAGLSIFNGVGGLLGGLQAGAVAEGGSLAGPALLAGGGLNIFRALGQGAEAYGAARAGSAGVPILAGLPTASGEAFVGETAGAGFLSSFGTGFTTAMAAAPAGWLLLGGIAAKTFIDKFDEGVQGNITKANAKVLGHPGSPTGTGDIEKLLGSFEFKASDLGLSDVEQAVGQGEHGGGRIATAGDLRKALADANSGYSNIINRLKAAQSDFQQFTEGEDLSKKVDRVKESVTALNQITTAGLEKIANDPQVMTKFLDELRKDGKYDALFGQGTSYEDAANSINNLINASQAAGGDPTKLGDDATKKISILGGELDKVPGIQNDINEQLTAQKNAADAVELTISDAANAKSAFESGLITFTEYVKSLNAAQKALDQLAQGGNPQAVRNAANNRLEISKATSEQLAQQADLNLQFSALAGGDPHADVDILSGLLRNPKFTDQKQRLTYTNKLVEALKKERDFQASMAKDAVERAKILSQPIPIPPEAQIAFIIEQLNVSSNEWGNFKAQLDPALASFGDALAQDVANFIVNGVKTVNDAERLSLTILRNGLQAQLNKVNAALNNKLERANLSSDEINALQRQQDLLEAEIAGANAAFANIGADPEAAPTAPGTIQPDKQQLQQAQQAAADQTRQDAKRLRDAQRAVLLALAGGDPVKQAQVAQQAADEALHDAETDPSLNAIQRQAAILEAQAQRITADHQLRDAIKAIAAAHSSLIQAMLNAVGDTVGAANEAAAEAQRELDQALNEAASGQGPGDAAIEQLRANAITAAANAREAALQDKLQHEQFLKDIGQVTTAQYIEFLQTLLADPTLIKKDRENIERQIYQLKQQMGQDFKFNLPSILGLPSLYEARRFDQAGGGIGYQDNRTINVNVTSTQNADPRALANAISNAIGPPRQFSTYSNRY